MFDDGTVDRLNRQPVTALEHTVRNRDVLKPAIRLCPELDAPCSEHFFIRSKMLEAGVQHGTFLEVSGHGAICNSHHLRRARIPQRVGTLQADAVVPGRIHSAIGNADVPAAIDVHAVAVGIDREIVDGEVVDAGGQNAEVAAVENTKIAQQDIAAIFQCDGLVPCAGMLGSRLDIPTAAQPLAPNQASANDGYILQALTPNQAVVPMILAEVLIRLPGRI